MSLAPPRPDVEALRLLRSGRASDALPYAERAAASAKVCMPAHGLLATILLQLGRRADAESVVVGALAYPSGIADAYDALAFVSMQLGRHERANELYRRTVELAPTSARFWYNLASSERSFGRLAQAEAACDRAIVADGGHYPSYLLRSELRLQTETDNHVPELEALLARPDIDDRARMFVGYALAKELDDLQRFDAAARWFDAAAATRRRHLAYDVGLDERKHARIAEVFPGTPAPGRKERGDSGRFVFIVGLPRSGTTLVERILGGLPGVRSNGETENFSQALLSSAPPGSDDVFSRAARANPEQVAARYAELAGDARDGTVIEKLPLNYLYLGAIHRALPDAKLVLVRRTPIDSCFAMYRTLFGEAYPFSYDHQDLARYYAAYDRLMRHWRSCFGARLVEVVYEDLVAAPQPVGAALAGSCGLPWRASAVEVTANAAVSLTASAAQIRRPIYGTSSGRWRHYRSHLGALIGALRANGVALPDDA
jgi:tetratricopeptide (TPR) repeat protein